MDKKAKKINELHDNIAKFKFKTLNQMIEIGRLLTNVRDIKKGTYLAWLKDNVNFSERTAHKYMRVYRLSKTPLWDNDKTVARNLRENAEPSLKKVVARDIKQQLVKQIAPKLSKVEVAKITDTFDRVKVNPLISYEIPMVGEKKKKEIRLCIFNAMEKSHLLGRKDKILPIEEKRATYLKIIKIIEQ